MVLLAFSLQDMGEEGLCLPAGQGHLCALFPESLGAMLPPLLFAVV